MLLIKIVGKYSINHEKPHRFWNATWEDGTHIFQTKIQCKVYPDTTKQNYNIESISTHTIFLWGEKST